MGGKTTDDKLADRLIQIIIATDIQELTSEEQLLLEQLIAPLLDNIRVKGAGVKKKVLLNRLANRLPHPMLLQSFPEFKLNIDSKVSSFVDEYFLNYTLENQIMMLYPNTLIIQNTTLAYFSINYLLPEHRLAILVSSTTGKVSSQTKLFQQVCQQQGYLPLELLPRYSTHQELKRSIRRQLFTKCM